MKAIAAPPAARARTVTPAEVLDTTRVKVRELLSNTAAFKELPPDKQRAIAHNTVEILRYLAAPEGIPATNLPANQGAQTQATPFTGEQRAAQDQMTREGFQNVA